MDELTCYIVLDGDSHTEIAEEVENLMREGWKPQGGVCVTAPRTEDGWWVYTQAMVK